MDADQTANRYRVSAETLPIVAGLCWLLTHGYSWWGLAGSVVFLMVYAGEGYVATTYVAGSLLAATCVYAETYGMALGIQGLLVMMMCADGHFGSATLSCSFFVLAFLGSSSYGQNTELVSLERSPPAAVRAELPAAQQTRVDELAQQIDKWKENRTKLCALVAKLERERVELLRQLDQRGVTSPGESDPRAKVLLEELRDVLRQQILVRGKHDQYDLAILKAEAQLRRIERRIAAEGVGINEAELSQLAKIVIDLDESVAAATETELPVELDRILAEQVGGKRAEQ